MRSATLLTELIIDKQSNHTYQFVYRITSSQEILERSKGNNINRFSENLIKSLGTCNILIYDSTFRYCASFTYCQPHTRHFFKFEEYHSLVFIGYVIYMFSKSLSQVLQKHRTFHK